MGRQVLLPHHHRLVGLHGVRHGELGLHPGSVRALTPWTAVSCSTVGGPSPSRSTSTTSQPATERRLPGHPELDDRLSGGPEPVRRPELVGSGGQSSVIDNLIVEISSANQIVWSWTPPTHIDVANETRSTGGTSTPTCSTSNSVEYDGDGGHHLQRPPGSTPSTGLRSLTGDITWKLGGTTTPQSLSVTGNQYTQLFSGQHFAWLAPNGDLLRSRTTVSRAGRLPRAVQFKIETRRM